MPHVDFIHIPGMCFFNNNTQLSVSDTVERYNAPGSKARVVASFPAGYIYFI